MATSPAAVIEATVAALERLTLGVVPVAWVDQVQDGQYTEPAELPAEFEAAVEGVEVGEVLGEVQAAAEQWIAIHQGEAEEGADDTANTTASFYRKGYWTILTTEHGVRHPTLLAVLFSYIDSGQEAAADEAGRELGLRAAALYLTLLGLPGSGAFKIFHPLLYSRALDVFKAASRLAATKASPKRKGAKASQGRGASQSQNTSVLSQEEGGAEEVLGVEEGRRLVLGLTSVLRALHLTLANCSLKRSQESVEVTVTALTSLTALETTLALDPREGRVERAGTVASLAMAAYRGLALLCSALHGDRQAGARAVLRGLLPALLMAEKEQQAELSPKERAVVREHGLNFVLSMLEGRGEEVEEVQRAVAVLVQHMAAKVPDKADWRREAAAAIILLLEALPAQLLQTTVRWLLR